MRKFILFLIVLLAGTSYFAYKYRGVIYQYYIIKKGQPEWAHKQIEADFADFSGGISQVALNETFERALKANIAIYRYRVIGGKIYRKGPGSLPDRVKVFDKMLKRLNRCIGLPNLDFIVCLMDGVPECYVAQDFWIMDEQSAQAPLLAWAKKEGAKYVVLIPDVLTTIERLWHRDIEKINQANRKIPWNQRIEKAFWRGTTSDKRYSLENYSSKPRFRLSHLSQQAPEWIDAGFNSAYSEELRTFFREIGVLKGHQTLAEHIRFKYLPVLDGWMCTYPGFQWRLLSGSLTMKQESNEIQYFYSALKPYVHYLPIRNDMSDVVEKVRWAKEHDAECEQMAVNARQFALQHLMPEPIYAYFYAVLKRYASLQRFQLTEEMLVGWEAVH
jgi:hypothetical protein